jgi:hypothetical protein
LVAQRKRCREQATRLDPSRHDREFFNRSNEWREFYAEIMEDNEFCATTDMGFAQLAAAHIRRKGYNRQVFVEKTRLSARTYDRIMDDEMPVPLLDTVMAICLGLHLGPEHSERLLEKAGYRLNSSPLHMAYRKLLNDRSEQTIEKYNEALVALGLRPIRLRSRRNAT